jgi:hypothetical protein
MGAALLLGQTTGWGAEKSEAKNVPTIWPTGLMADAKPANPTGRPGSSMGAL